MHRGTRSPAAAAASRPRGTRTATFATLTSPPLAARPASGEVSPFVVSRGEGNCCADPCGRVRRANQPGWPTFANCCRSSAACSVTALEGLAAQVPEPHPEAEVATWIATFHFPDCLRVAGLDGLLVGKNVVPGWLHTDTTRRDGFVD